MSEQITRRKFLKVLGVTTAALPVSAALNSFIPNDVKADPTTAVDAASAKAVSFGYSEDATKVDTVKFPKRAGEAGAKQYCDNCQLFLKGGLTVAGKTDTYGVCSLFQEGLVAGKGWCNMWVAKVG